MGSFARTLDLGRAIPHLVHRRGVVKAAELNLVGQARAIIEDAEREAGEILQSAQRRAEQMLEQHRQETEREREDILHKAETEIWKQAAQYQQSQDKRFGAFVAELQGQALPVVRKAIMTLAHDMPPEQRLHACVHALYAELGRPTDATLRVNGQDRAALESMQPALAWPIEIDDDIEPGTCMLSSRRGEWASSFTGRLERLLAVFALSGSENDVEDREAIAH